MSASVCVFGTGDADSVRSRAVLDEFRRQGFQVHTACVPLKPLRSRDSMGLLAWLLTLLSLPWRYCLLAWRFLKSPQTDLILVPYPGHLDIHFARLLCHLKGRSQGRPKILLDFFIGLHETLVLDRQRLGRSHPLASLLQSLDRWALRGTDIVISDTPEHTQLWRQYWSRLQAIHMPVLAPPGFIPWPKVASSPSTGIKVLHIGTHIPLHGGGTIIEAARRLESEGFEFEMIGHGQERSKLQASAPGNVVFRAPIPLEQIPLEISRADIVLGIFGDSEKARVVVPHKVVQAMACAAVLVTAEHPAAARILTQAKEAILVPAKNPEALAQALQSLKAQRSRWRELSRATRQRYCALRWQQADLQSLI